MPKLAWDTIGERFFELGVDHGVLYPYNSTSKQYDNGVAWNGLTSVSESPSGADANKVYADNINYFTLYSVEEFGATIEAYTYPDEFEACDGSAKVNGVSIGQQTRQAFGLSYRTKVGNDTEGQDLAYKIHLIYGCRASPSDRSYESINDSPEAITFSWELTTTPVPVTGYKPTASLIIDSRDFTETAAKAKLDKLEAVLYGTDATTGLGTGIAAPGPRLPLPDDVIALLGN